ncbi:MAG TPA: ATPase [Actinobacteria bacterium]|nr:ATPase [Actinomycetota bacterium]
MPQGLTSVEAAARLARDGQNLLPPPRPVPLWHRIATQLRDPLVLVLLVAAVLTIATGDWTDASVILLVIVVNTSVGVIQEVKAGQAIAALTQLAAPEARVLRDGKQRPVPAADLVVGDLLVLAEGDIVPADAAVVEAAALLVDEAALTGESVPVDKAAGDGTEQPGEVVSAGTVVVRGRGRAVVTATGTASAMGRVAALMSAPSGLTPLQRRLVGVGRVLAVAAVLLCAIVLVVGLIRGQPAELMVITAISLVVAAVPESLPAVVTLALALGARRMAARHALIRRLPAVETLGSVTVLGTDKTGTLTEGNMVARHLWTPLGEVTISGTGYGPAGEVTRNGQPVKPGDAPDLTALLTAAVACNDAAIHRPEESGEPWTAVGDPTEAALLSAAAKFGLSQAEVNAGLPRYAEIPFESGRKRMTTVHRLADGGARIICKGAPEAMLSRPVLDGDPAALRLAADRAEEFARDGFRVLAVATADRPPGEAPAAVPAAPAPARDRPGIATAGLDADGPEPAAPGTAAPGTGSPGHPPAGTATAAELELERGLRLLGLIAILDPPRPSAAATIAACQAAGIVPVLITGDHPATARSIATELGIIEPGEPVVDCRGTAADGDRGEATARVFARATPEQKLAVIQARRAAGDVVAMTGDGVNDGPALRRADIGVAMGRRGTEVARQAADLVLADDELRTVVAAAEEGRRVYANIRRFLLYGLSGGSADGQGHGAKDEGEQRHVHHGRCHPSCWQRHARQGSFAYERDAGHRADQRRARHHRAGLLQHDAGAADRVGDEEIEGVAVFFAGDSAGARGDGVNDQKQRTQERQQFHLHVTDRCGQVSAGCGE